MKRCVHSFFLGFLPSYESFERMMDGWMAHGLKWRFVLYFRFVLRLGGQASLEKQNPQGRNTKRHSCSHEHKSIVRRLAAYRGAHTLFRSYFVRCFVGLAGPCMPGLDGMSCSLLAGFGALGRAVLLNWTRAGGEVSSRSRSLGFGSTIKERL